MTTKDILQLIFMVVWPIVCSMIALWQMTDLDTDLMIMVSLAISVMNMIGLCAYIFVAEIQKVKEGVKNERGY